jgi:transcriptional regulator with XRE-family HTH domain
MAFPQRLGVLRKRQNLTQHALAELVGVHLTQIQRYENGSSQPTLDVIRKLAMSLAVSADALIFDADERGPDDELKLQFEAIKQLPPEDKHVIKAMLDGMIVKHRTRQLAQLHT